MVHISCQLGSIILDYREVGLFDITHLHPSRLMINIEILSGDIPRILIIVENFPLSQNIVWNCECVIKLSLLYCRLYCVHYSIFAVFNISFIIHLYHLWKRKFIKGLVNMVAMQIQVDRRPHCLSTLFQIRRSLE